MRFCLPLPGYPDIDKAERDYGCFALISNGIKDPFEALELYRANHLIEKAFDSLKERLSMRRQFVSSEDSLDAYWVPVYSELTVK